MTSFCGGGPSGTWTFGLVRFACSVCASDFVVTVSAFDSLAPFEGASSPQPLAASTAQSATASIVFFPMGAMLRNFKVKGCVTVRPTRVRWVDSPLLTSVALPAAIAVIMCSLGLTLTREDFRRVLLAPRGVAIGMLNLTLISPLLALAMAELFALPPELAVGLVLLGASPGGMMANMLTHLSRGDTALSVTMTAVSSVGAIVTVPLFLELSADRFGADALGEAGMLGVVTRVFAITVVPVAIGMELRRRRPAQVESAYPRVRNVALGLFAAVVAGAIASEYDTVAENVAEVAGAALALNLAAMGLSFAISKLARLDDRQSTAIALELGIHNSALAIAVGAPLAANVSIPAAVYASFMLFTGGAFAWAMSRRNAELEETARAEPAEA
jgi:bile acid:Na+ symporter, BASS family